MITVVHLTLFKTIIIDSKYFRITNYCSKE